MPTTWLRQPGTRSAREPSSRLAVPDLPRAQQDNKKAELTPSRQNLSPRCQTRSLALSSGLRPSAHERSNRRARLEALVTHMFVFGERFWLLGSGRLPKLINLRESVWHLGERFWLLGEVSGPHVISIGISALKASIVVISLGARILTQKQATLPVDGSSSVVGCPRFDDVGVPSLASKALGPLRERFTESHRVEELGENFGPQAMSYDFGHNTM